MSEQESNTPSKPKVGSLKDRIAAFEKSAQNDNTPAQKPMAPRAKPNPVSWKPASSSPKDEGGDEPGSDKKHGGMSAEDAKESIAAGGGLKARMAALQGSMNNVGASPATPPPAPKPMRKPFVPRPPTPDEDSEEGSENKEKSKEPLVSPRRRLDNWDPLAATVAAVGARQRSTSPPGAPEDHHDGHAAQSSVEEQNQEQNQEQTEEQEQDEETKERERRAALAARMARLGGARIGMAPPIIPKKPKPATPLEEEESPVTVKANFPTPVRVLPMPERRATEDRVQTPVEVKETGSDTLRTVTAEDEATSRAAPLPTTSPLTSGGLSEKRSYSFHEETSSSQTSLASSGSHPSSIPIPAMPRRVAPPRSKHSARSLKSEQSNYEPDSPETKVAQDATSATAEEKTESETTDAVQSLPIAEDPAAPQGEEGHNEDHEGDDLTEKVKPSSYENETTEEIEYYVDHEERKEEEEAVFEEEGKAADEENFAEPEKTEEEDEEAEEAEEAGEQASQLYTPQEEEEIAPPPPPRRQESSHSAISSSKATEPSPPTPDSKHFFQDTAGESHDS